LRREYLTRNPENAQRKIRRGDYRDMERADRDMEELENTPDLKEGEPCPQPIPGQRDQSGDAEKKSF
jgi:hypothetical protein